MVEQIALDGGGDNSIRSQGGRQDNFVGSNGDGDDRHSSGSLRHTKESVADIKEAEEQAAQRMRYTVQTIQVPSASHQARSEYEVYLPLV